MEEKEEESKNKRIMEMKTVKMSSCVVSAAEEDAGSCYCFTVK